MSLAQGVASALRSPDRGTSTSTTRRSRGGGDLYTASGPKRLRIHILGFLVPPRACDCSRYYSPAQTLSSSQGKVSSGCLPRLFLARMSSPVYAPDSGQSAKERKSCQGRCEIWTQNRCQKTESLFHTPEPLRVVAPLCRVVCHLCLMLSVLAL